MQGCFFRKKDSPFMKVAENPAFCTEPSVTNFILILLPVLLTSSGVL